VASASRKTPAAVGLAASVAVAVSATACGGWLVFWTNDSGPTDADLDEASPDVVLPPDADEDVAPPNGGPWSALIREINVSAELVCDVNGVPPNDNCLAALGPVAGEVADALSEFFNEGAAANQRKFMLYAEWLDDLGAPTDPDVRLMMFPVTGVDGIRENDFTSGEDFLVAGDWVSVCGEALFGSDGSVTGGAASFESGDMLFPLAEATIPIFSGRLDGTIAPHGGDANLTFCGHITAQALAVVENVYGSNRNLLEVVTFPEQLLGNPLITGVQPDVDNDGDGLEEFTIDPMTGTIVSCVDGDGEQIVGRDCVLNEQIADSFAFTFDLVAVPGRFAGCETDWRSMATVPCRGDPADAVICE
jgi:hypothetical protein